MAGERDRMTAGDEGLSEFEVGFVGVYEITSHIISAIVLDTQSHFKAESERKRREEQHTHVLKASTTINTNLSNCAGAGSLTSSSYSARPGRKGL